MKRIEEAAKIHSERQSYGVWKDNAVESFKAGVEFAQRWIPVEEELPNNFTSVLVRDNECSPIRSTAIYLDGVFHPDFVLTHNQVTHWRPIEYK